MGSAKLSPKNRGIADLEARVARLEAFERWREPHKIDFAAVVGAEIWEMHRTNWREALAQLRKSQVLAEEIKSIIAQKVSPSLESVTRGTKIPLSAPLKDLPDQKDAKV